MRSQVLALCLVIAGALALPLGLRAVNRALPGAGIKEAYLPSIETPRPREPFDEEAAAALREAQPEFVVIGDSTAGGRINPAHLSRQTGTSVAGLFHPGSPVAYWYLQFKNLIADNGLTSIRGVIFFFRDDQLTTQVEVRPADLDRVARDREPELDRIMAAHRLGRFSDVHRLARSVYEFDRTRVWLEPRLHRVPAVVSRSMPADELIRVVNAGVFALDRLRPFAAADLPQAEASVLDFDARLGSSLLPEILRVAALAKIRLAFIRVQRRPAPDGPPPQSVALVDYMRRLRDYLAARGAYFHDDWGDPGQPLAAYVDGDHLAPPQRNAYTERFARQHASFLR